MTSGHTAGEVRTARSEPPSVAVLAGIAGIGAGGLLLAAIHLGTNGAVGIPCPLLALTGIACPLCGSTRMAGALLRGDFATALRSNAPVLVGGLAIGYLWLSWVGQRLGVARLPRPRLGPRGRRRLFAVVIVIAVIFMVLRNLPWAPFTALAV